MTPDEVRTRFRAVVARAMAKPLEKVPAHRPLGVPWLPWTYGTEAKGLRGRRSPAYPNQDGSFTNDDNPGWETARRDQ